MSPHHSSAPWRVVQGDRCLHVVSADAGFSTGCISFDGRGFGNANLVAAAPDLLAALRIAQELLERNGIQRPEIDAAIATAEGKGQAA